MGKNRMAAFAFMAIVVSLTESGSNRKQTAFRPAQMILAVGVVIIAIFWREVTKALEP
jgi:hypothetical protein